MKLIKGSKNIGKINKAVLTIGNFDGVHKGHQHIIAKACERAGAIKGTTVVYTFEPHPAKVIAPDVKLKLIQTVAQKASALKATNAKICVIENFTKSFSKMPAEEFLEEVIKRRFSPAEMVIGHDLTFGWHRKGNAETLEKFCELNGIKLTVIEPQFSKEILISSTQIREFIADGKIESANALLTRPFALEGVVIKGRRIGAQIGFHTANLACENELVPPTGVYITRALGRRSVTNIGYNPTVGGSVLSIETHIIDFSKNIYGKRLKVDFFKRIRKEMLFDDTEGLKKQIGKDILEALRYEKF